MSQSPLSLSAVYGADAPAQADRLRALVARLNEAYGPTDGPVYAFSAPGRSEIIGNHTDHQQGCVVAAAVDLDAVAVARPRSDGVIRLWSQGYEPDEVDLSTCEPAAAERGTSAALIRGVAATLRAWGFTVGGFDAVSTSRVLKGSGLSSSAAFEVLVAAILNGLYNDGRVDPQTAARAAQRAENDFFGKPSGLMDQMASAVGGLVAMDFADPAAPVIHPVACDFAAGGMALCVVDTGGDHADLTDAYAAVPREMRAVAAALGRDCLRGVDPDELYARLGELRACLPDRALLRACHFVEENQRAIAAREVLEAGDFRAFRRLITASGRSSFCYLQNVIPPDGAGRQGLALALLLCEHLLTGRGAWRVHGGGFAGTVQAFVPEDLLDGFRQETDGVFGPGSCHVLRVRPVGMTALALPD